MTTRDFLIAMLYVTVICNLITIDQLQKDVAALESLQKAHTP